MPRFENVLVTGASRGLGAALGRELLARGHRVVLTARNRAELAQAVDSLRAQHGDRVGWIAAFTGLARIPGLKADTRKGADDSIPVHSSKHRAVRGSARCSEAAPSCESGSKVGRCGRD